MGDFEFGVADAVAVADADFGVRQPGDGEVFSEMTGREVVSTQVGLPEVVRFGLIHHDRALLAAVSGEIALAVAVEVEPAGHDRPLDRGFPYPGIDGLVPPSHVLGHADVY